MLPIVLRGARAHNLRGIDLDLAPASLVAVTGPSGAGKSSLALDTLYAEGQRRFVESFSPYARQFLERLERPPMDRLAPIAATVAVDRRAPVKSSRSTLATMADLEPYLAALFAREAIPTCPDCDVEAVATTPRSAALRAATALDGVRALVTYPLAVEDAESFLELREGLARDGFRRLVVAGAVRGIDEVRPSEASAPGVRVEVVVDRVQVSARESGRLQEAIELAWSRGGGQAELRADAGDHGRVAVTRGLACPKCARTFDPPRPGLFSYNSPFGACDACRGFGRVIAVDWDKVIPDPRKSLRGGAIRPWSGPSTTWERGVLEKFCAKRKIPQDVPWARLTEEQRRLVLDGEGTWQGGKYPGVRAWFKWLEGRTYKMHVRVLLSRFREYGACDQCGGSRLNRIALAYRIGGRNLAGWHRLTVAEARALVAQYDARDPQGMRVKEHLTSRLAYLDAVGLGYLTLDRQARTLSGGEAQRAGLTTALGAALTGTLFVLDEPTVGLHVADIPALAAVMRDLSRTGNTVLVVEHDPAVIQACDRVIELGPGAGHHGGRVLFDGTPAELARRTDLPTGRAWAESAARGPKRASPRHWLELRGAREHNLEGIDVRFPLGVMCAVTGPSGSGKSTLAHHILYRAAARGLGDLTVDKAGRHDSLEGLGALSRAVLVDQSPLGRTARGNPATYVKAWDRVRARFAAEAESMRRGLTAAHFSFNVPAGRCEECAGEGYETVEMQFLADVHLLCAVCQGRRFKPDVLAVSHRGRNIADVLAMTVVEALEAFDPPNERDYVLRRALEPIVQVGLGYLPLGQPLSTLSGGEAQRLKLARAVGDGTGLGKEQAKGTLFVVDEPSAGLHAQDAGHVIATLRSLVAEGASVVLVEHDLDVIRACDWVIDLGPGGGPEGGRLVAEGTPEQVATSGTRTGDALRTPAGPPGRSELPRPPSAITGGPPPGEAIFVSHAREHNLKEVSCTIPHGSVCVVTGPSGSGKSSLAFDVIFAEGQRRFMETLTPYARQFLPTLPRPDVDTVTGVPPSIALEQRTSRGGANSTVATVTEVAHYLRLLFAKVGEMHCPKCDAVVAPMSADALFERLTRSRDAGHKTVYAPAVRARKGTYLDLFTSAARAGVKAARVDGGIVSIEPPPKLAKTKEHSIDLIVHYGRLSTLDRETFDRALAWGAGAVRVGDGAPSAKAGPKERMLSTARTCPSCATGVPEIDPRWFSFNTKQGRCEACDGTGVEGGAETVEELEEDRLEPCETCAGSRLSAIPRGVRLFGETYARTTARSVSSALARARTWTFDGTDAEIAKAPLAELVRRLAFVEQVGLGYLALDRPAATLSGGEMQRLRLSAQLGSGLTGALYVLDEPTIGLHPRDTRRLLENLRQLADMGSTVVVVEHDAETIRAADHVIDLGPGGGRRGGHIVAEGPAHQVLSDMRSPTAQALRDTARLVRPKRPMADAWVELVGARAHNLKDVTFRVPVGRMCVVAGVSGSGKSTLVRHVFYPALRRALKLVAPTPGPHDAIKGHRGIKRAIAVDQSPIGRTPRSVPATFLGVWDDVRKLFGSLPEAKTRGYSAARFSFNTASGGGRCPACEGQGNIVAEMPFLPDVVAPCDACGGARFEPSTLEVKYAGLSIGDVLHMPAEDAAQIFTHHPKIARPLVTLADLGVGYVQIGQGSNTLSGGEAQRLKLAAELTAGSAHEPTLYVLDEPTTGLHLTDVRRLLGVLERLVARGDTLVIVEHHPDVIASADWIVELGPDAGEGGGRVVFEGEPRKLEKARTATGKILARGTAAAAE